MEQTEGAEPTQGLLQAIERLTEWKHIARLVEAFGGGWEAVAAIAIIALAVVVIVISLLVVSFLSYKLKQNTRVRLAELGVDPPKGRPWIPQLLFLWLLRRRR